MRTVFRAIFVVSLALYLGSAAAELPKKDRKQVKQLLSGTLYARIDIPCETGRHAWGTYLAPLVEVTPEGTNTESDMGFSASVWHAQSTFWGVGPNDTLEVSDISYDEGNIEIELEGVGPTDGIDTVILFKDINSLDDFNKAFELAFSKAPLQDEHPDWSENIRQAIAERHLLKGMNKRQAYYILGSPERFEKSEENGKEVEIWYTRQQRGTQMGFWYSSTETTGYPKTLKFVDGALEEWSGSVSKGKGKELDLDD